MSFEIKKYSEENRILQTRSVSDVYFIDPDIEFTNGYTVPENNLESKIATITFDKVLTKAAARFNIGTNAELFKNYSGTNAITKDLNENTDGNGPRPGAASNFFYKNYLFLMEQDKSLIAKISTPSTSLEITPIGGNIIFNHGWESLKEIDFSVGTFVDNINTEVLPVLKILKLSFNRSTNENTFTGFKSSSLKYINLNRGLIVDILPLLPLSVIYAHLRGYATEMIIDLKNYFIGHRMGVYVDNARALGYSGGAVFPAVISDDTDFRIEYILYQNSNVVNKLTGNSLSRFLLDFANQVISVECFYKRIRVRGSTPNTSYADLSQPLYKTYNEALSYITGTLGVTVTFT